MTSFSLDKVVQNQDAMRIITKWALELIGQGISYVSQTVIKSQVLVDFIAEWTKVKMPLAIVDQKY